MPADNLSQQIVTHDLHCVYYMLVSIMLPTRTARLGGSTPTFKVTLLQVMGKNKILVKVHPEGKYVVDLHKDIDINKVTTGKLTHKAVPSRLSQGITMLLLL